ncbi:MAG TPA: hypothetical protein VF701_21010 [Thermoanaerobaculia bacterium]
MTMPGVLTRSLLSATLATLVLAAFGELRPSPAAFLMVTIVFTGLVRDLTAYHRTT